MNDREPTNLTRGRSARIVAGLTVVYGVGTVIAPRLIAQPTGLTDSDGHVPPQVASLIRSVGLRDAALAAALGALPAGPPMSIVTVAKVVSDAADAVWLGRIVPSGQRGKIIAAALGWATLEAVVGWMAHREARSS
jgi:hypothetical protein